MHIRQRHLLSNASSQIGATQMATLLLLALSAGLIACCAGATVTLTATPTVLTSSPANVTLKWSGLDAKPVGYSIGAFVF